MTGLKPFSYWLAPRSKIVVVWLTRRFRTRAWPQASPHATLGLGFCLSSTRARGPFSRPLLRSLRSENISNSTFRLAPLIVNKDGSQQLTKLPCAALSSTHFPGSDRHHRFTAPAPSARSESLSSSYPADQSVTSLHPPRLRVPCVINAPSPFRAIPLRWLIDEQDQVDFLLPMPMRSQLFSITVVEVSPCPSPQTDSTIPTHNFQARVFTLANNVTWIFGRCDDRGCFKVV